MRIFHSHSYLFSLSFLFESNSNQIKLNNQKKNRLQKMKSIPSYLYYYTIKCTMFEIEVN